MSIAMSNIVIKDLPNYKLSKVSIPKFILTVETILNKRKFKYDDKIVKNIVENILSTCVVNGWVRAGSKLEANMFEKIAGLTKSMVTDVVVPLLSNEDVLSPADLQVARLKICHAPCPYLKSRTSCELCGCDLMRISALKNKKCKIGKWEKAGL